MTLIHFNKLKIYKVFNIYKGRAYQHPRFIFGGLENELDQWSRFIFIHWEVGVDQ
jgi:hypothetical protein